MPVRSRSRACIPAIASWAAARLARASSSSSLKPSWITPPSAMAAGASGDTALATLAATLVQRVESARLGESLALQAFGRLGHRCE